LAEGRYNVCGEGKCTAGDSPSPLPENKGETMDLSSNSLTDLQRVFSDLRKHQSVVVVMSGVGLLVFGLTAFLGYPSDDGTIQMLFHPPAVLFLWLMSLVVALQILIFRKRSQELIRALCMTVLSVALIAVAYAEQTHIPEFLGALEGDINDLLGLLHLATGQGRLLFSIINFSLILGFLGNSTVRAIRVWRGGPPNRQRPEERPSLADVVAGDLIASALIAITLSLILQFQVLLFVVDNVVRPYISNFPEPTSCTLKWALGVCPSPPSTPDPPALSDIDTWIWRFCALGGVLILAPQTVLAGFAAIERQLQLGLVERSLSEVAKEVLLDIWNTLKSALNRSFSIAFTNLANLVRVTMWPILILAGSVGIAFCAYYILGYLHLASDIQACAQSQTESQPPICIDLQQELARFGFVSTAAFQTQSWDHNRELARQLQLVFLLVVIVVGTGATFAIVFSSKLLADEGERKSLGSTMVTLRHQALTSFLWVVCIAVVPILTLWLFEVILFIVNQMWLEIGLVPKRYPFSQPSYVTAASFGILVVGGVIGVFFVRRRRNPSAQ
jgi:hypothetical protein